MRILNFGSLNIDYVYGVDHFAAKGQTITSHALDVFPGGKGLNQSIALARAGADVHHAGQVGRDGMFLRDLLETCAVGVTSVVVQRHHPKRCQRRQLHCAVPRREPCHRP